MMIPVKIGQKVGGVRGTASSSVGKDRSDMVPDWSIIELQGELISKEPLSGQHLGTMTSEEGKPTLVIGNHKLEGKAAAEPKPLLVLRKVIVPRPSDRGGGDRSVGEGAEIVGRKTSVEYHVVGRVTKKTIFKTRPKPLIRKIG